MSIRVPLAVLLLAGLAWAEERPLTIAKAEFATREKQLFVVAEGGAQLPDKARLVMMLSMDGQTNSEYYASVYVEGGSWKGEIGPFEQQLLPGRYVLVVDFMMGDQHPAIQKALKQGTLPPMCLRDVVPLVWGDDKAEKEARRKAAEHYLTRAGEAAKLLEEFLAGLDEFRSGKRFCAGGGRAWDAQAWMPWTDGLMARVNKLDEEEQSIGGDAFLGRYFPEAHLEYGSMVTSVRYVICSHTLDFLRGAGMPLPELYAMPDRAEGPFRDPNRFPAILEMAGNVRKIVTSWTEETEKDWAFYRTAPSEERRQVAAYCEATLVRLRDLVAELREKAESAKGTWDPKAWDVEFDVWAGKLKDAVPKRRLARIRMEAGPESVLSFKYPYVLDLMDQAARDASSYGQSTSAWLYLAAGQEAPRKYFGNLSDEAPTPKPPIEQVEEERARWQELFAARLDFLAKQLGLTPPK